LFFFLRGLVLVFLVPGVSFFSIYFFWGSWEGRFGNAGVVLGTGWREPKERLWRACREEEEIWLPRKR
jgi:hypothetical protein